MQTGFLGTTQTRAETHVAYKVFISEDLSEVLTVTDVENARTFIIELQDHIQYGNRPFSLETTGTDLLGVRQSKFDDIVVTLVVYQLSASTSSEIKLGNKNPKLGMVPRDEISKFANFHPETRLEEILLDMLEEFFVNDLGLPASDQT